MATIEMSAATGPRSETSTRRRGRLPDLSALKALSVDRVLVVVASLMLPMGFVAIFLAWYGAAHTPFLFEQVPYLISGGLLGVGLLAGGGLLYFGGWIAKLSEQQREDNAQLRELLRGIREDLRSTAALTGGATTAPAGADSLVATATGSMVHRPDCSVVTGKSGLREVSQFEAGAMKPCKLCQPPVS